MQKGTGTKSRISITLDSKTLSALKKKLSPKLVKVSNYIEYLVQEDLKNESKK
jgi:hypothetical protein